MSTNSNPTPRTRIVREAQRAVYDRDTVNQILDEAFLCHVGFVADGQPFVIPTSYGRDGNVLYLHGSAASRMLRNLDQGTLVCVTITLLDGLVLARSVFNHSMNYRSVVILGTATLVEKPAEKIAALRALSEHILPHRWDDARQPHEGRLFVSDLGGGNPAGDSGWSRYSRRPLPARTPGVFAQSLAPEAAVLIPLRRGAKRMESHSSQGTR